MKYAANPKYKQSRGHLKQNKKSHTMQTNEMKLYRTQGLYDNSTGTIGKTSDQFMIIMPFDRNTIVVQGVSPGGLQWFGLG